MFIISKMIRQFINFKKNYNNSNINIAAEIKESIRVPDNLLNSVCLASFEARGVRILSIHWYSGSSFTTSSSTKPSIALALKPQGILPPIQNLINQIN